MKKSKSEKNKRSAAGFNKNLFLIPIFIILGFFVVFLLPKKQNEMQNEKQEVPVVKDEEVVDLFDFESNYGDRKVVVAYFSQTGKTKAVAEKFANVFKCDTVAIEPVEPYTYEDITSQDSSTRPMREAAYDPFYPPEEPEDDTEVDESIIRSLPEIKKLNFNKYDTIFLGYPIWYGDAPRVIYTFISQTNLKDKVIIPFCTSDNDDISPSDNDLANFAPEGVHFMSGRRFTVDSTDEDVKNFVVEIGVDIDTWD